ncbi:hypothetical protein C5L14_11065 [Labrys okinawensis]|uniref:Uncharacterized protein n=1 Tax=Labrys okinawensis TaxID=346911 RepID=A0A2S9QCX3_9HYPH|nr:hypothetical protein [Labrys okinawensis]PRH87175.1 hypothetical protein C5L14_11065 [Labrys okinawensis]
MSETQIIKKVVFAVWWRIGIPVALFVFAIGWALNFLFYVAPMLQVTGSISHYGAMLIAGLLGGDVSAFLGDGGLIGNVVIGFFRAILDNLPMLVVLIVLTRWQIRRHLPRILRDNGLIRGGEEGSGS